MGVVGRRCAQDVMYPRSGFLEGLTATVIARRKCQADSEVGSK